jgi:uncharacterized membrane protein
MIPPFDDEIELLRLRAARLEQELRSLHSDIEQLHAARAITPAHEPPAAPTEQALTTPTERPSIDEPLATPLYEITQDEAPQAPPLVAAQQTPPLAPAATTPPTTPPMAHPVSDHDKRPVLHRLFREPETPTDDDEGRFPRTPWTPKPGPTPTPKPSPASEPVPTAWDRALAGLDAGMQALSLKRADGEADPHDKHGLEMRIGGVWFNRIGAVIILIGAAFLFKLSIDRGWLSPAMRVAAVALMGLGLITAGELALRKAMRTFAVGMLGGGIALLYLSAFGAHKFYGLIDQTPASFLYMGITAVSAGIAVHARLLPVAVLGLIGGLATPILLSRGDNKQVELLTYLLALDAAFLIVGAMRRWDVLRVLAWIGTAVLFGAWAVKYYPFGITSPVPEAVLHPVAWRTALFTMAFFALFHAEAVVSLRHGRALHGRLVAGIVSVNYAVFFAAVYFALREVVPQWMGAFAVLSAGLMWLTAWRLLGGLDVAVRTRRTLWIGGAGMLALAAPMQFDRYLVSISWSLQGVITLAFARRFAGEIWIRVKGVLLPVAALLHLLAFEYGDAALHGRFAEWGNWYASWLLLCFVGTGLCCYAGGALLVARRTPSMLDRQLAGGLVLLGTITLLGIFAEQWERFLASWWWIALAALWCAAGLRWRAAGAVGLLIAVAVVGKFLLFDTLAYALEERWDALSGIVLNRAVVTGVVVAGLVMFARLPGRRLAGTEWGGPIFDRQVKDLAALAAWIITWTGTFEILRAFAFEPWVLNRFHDPSAARGVFVTALWAAIALGLWLLPEVRRQRSLTGFATTLALLAAWRFLVIDTLQFARADHWQHLSGVLVNRQFLVGLLVIAMSVVIWRQLRASTGEHAARTSALALAATLLLVVWATSFEVLRAVRFEDWVRAMYDAPRSAPGVSLTALWAILAAALWLLPHDRRTSVVEPFALALGGLAFVRLLLADTLAFAVNGDWSALRGACVNRQFIVGAMVIALGFLMHRRLWTAAAAGRLAVCRVRPVIVAVLGATLLAITWVPTFEIVRVFRFEPVAATFENPTLAMNVALSIFWGLNAGALLVAGFARRSAVVRYAGLALFAVTVLKVFLVDMSSLDMVYRVVSFMVVGVLLLAASLLYQRLSARIVGREAPL